MSGVQPGLFDAEAGGLIPGLRYRPDFLTEAEERALVGRLSAVPFEAFQFHGFEGKRRTHSFGWRYVFDGSGLNPAEPLPGWLRPFAARAEEWAGLERGAIAHALLTEYSPGAGIGWHRDRSVFGDVVGLSLLAPARLRFRRRSGEKWERRALIAAPRSAYLLRGEARTQWEHSIAPMERLRYSITLRTLRAAQE
ncbi:MAG: alpha-ketoglutarate-dependent dioxygenase AlkB [Alphaproteobacteria bacterium]|nr:alpha-ketoglutarate-dependent dioxygenase AlkB [Alphaproteobacteria bacterium]MBV9371551.1 alpha-ketoglutarate-dependent dioxygenase AlkB [Alphaproteobacteria bacterium]MBV9902707.1 alpha-ketoglutarate-dependent dioxygenase AlkB [Alphaproteobacteria bacterium]